MRLLPSYLQDGLGARTTLVVLITSSGALLGALVGARWDLTWQLAALLALLMGALTSRWLI
ncbi:MAG: hypothetical protein AAGH65_04060, partial [Pseudomonadota bacterium]